MVVAIFGIIALNTTGGFYISAHAQGGQGGGAANDCEGDGEGEAEERARHREDDRLDHGQRGRGREA